MFAIGLAAWAVSVSTASAANITWEGDTSSTFSDGSNWFGGIAPANNRTTDTAVFGSTLPNGASTFQPVLTSTQSILSLNFSSATGG
jgi:hypothetical protein